MKTKTKLAMVVVLSILSFGAVAHWTGYNHCHGPYTILQDSYGIWYHQHIGWYHY